MNSASKIKINTDSLKSRREWKRHKIKDGHNIYRFMPPFGESANGYAYRKWQIIWGLANPQDGRMRPYASSMTSEKRCPVTELVKKMKTYSETLKLQLQASGVSEEEIKERLNVLNKLMSDLSPKTVYIYNAVDKAGELGLLELKSTAHKKLKTEMLDYIHLYNQDPTSLNSEDDDAGVWFDVIRTGIGRDTEYDVKKCQLRKKDEKGRITFADDRSPLPETVVDNFEKNAYDLSSVYQCKTYEELQEILEANLPALIKLCPDMAQIVGGNEVQSETAVKAAVLLKPAAQVNLKFHDDTDEEEQDTSELSSMSSDDDFMAKAEALLNG